MKLFPYQEPHLPVILRQLQTHRFSLNASDTGTGKTFLTLAALRHLPENPVLVVAPKSLHAMWEEELTTHCPTSHVLDILNIEKLRAGNTSWLVRHPPARKGAKPTFRWSLPPRPLVIADEVHVFSGADSQNGFILAYLRQVADARLIALSATCADSPAKLRALGFWMGLHSFVDFEKWALAHGCYRDQHRNLRYTSHSLNRDQLLALHAHIFPEYGIRMRIADIPDFPKNHIDAMLVDDDTPASWKRDFEARYPWVYDPVGLAPTHEESRTLADMMQEDRKPMSDEVLFLRQRQKAELAKVHYLCSNIPDLVEEGNNVVVFLNFLASIHETMERLSLPSDAIIGDTKNRKEIVDRFQNNELNVLFCTPGAGGVGLSLHDLHDRPRVSYISPMFAPVPFIQSLGRIHRAGARSPARQFILCLRGSAEEAVRKSIIKKRHQVSLINDGDLAPEIK